MKHHLIISCEHAGNDIPEEYKYLFEGKPEVLNTHEGWDPGALEIAKSIGIQLRKKVFACHTSRLLIEVNRSLSHEQLFSTYSKGLLNEVKERLIQEIYFPYRNQVESEISSTENPVLHFSIHSFTPVFNGVTREVDIGLLFDPTRIVESNVCEQMANQLARKLPGLEIRFNEPYQGIDDGFTTHLRKKWNDNRYAGIEIEVNQKWIVDSRPISESLATFLQQLSGV